jgi:ABC-type siderophore export system fused ATPase/permease subunit
LTPLTDQEDFIALFSLVFSTWFLFWNLFLIQQAVHHNISLLLQQIVPEFSEFGHLEKWTVLS